MDLQEFLRTTGRSMQRVKVDQLAGQPIVVDPVAPWEPVGAPYDTEFQRILAYLAGAEEITVEGKPHPVTPNLMVLVSAVTPQANSEEFIDLVVDTSIELEGWTTIEDLAGESDLGESGAEIPVVYRYLSGRYQAEVGITKTSSLLAGWNTDDATLIFQAVVTTFPASDEHHDSALESVRVGSWTLPQLVDAMRV